MFGIEIEWWILYVLVFVGFVISVLSQSGFNMSLVGGLDQIKNVLLHISRLSSEIDSVYSKLGDIETAIQIEKDEVKETLEKEVGEVNGDHISTSSAVLNIVVHAWRLLLRWVVNFQCNLVGMKLKAMRPMVLVSLLWILSLTLACVSFTNSKQLKEKWFNPTNTFWWKDHLLNFYIEA